jgi:ABC-type glycerol-3-phosphate transport system permease component
VDALPSSQQTDQHLSHNKATPSIVLVLTLLPILGACLLSVLPLGWSITQSIGEDGFSRLLEGISIGRVFVNSLVPPFLSAIVQLLISYCAALSIGALRPLGKRSEWLLLFFSPWLFVTLLPLSLVNLMAARESGSLNTFAALVSPVLIHIPALFILTIFFLGQAPHWQRASAGESSTSNAFFQHLVLPSLPLAGVILFFLFFTGWQDFFWPLLVSVQQDYYPWSLVIFQFFQSFAVSSGGIAAAVTLFVVPISFFLLAALVLFQVLYLDRLVLFSSREG